MSSESSRKKVIAILKLILLVIIVAGIPAFLYLRYGSGLFSKDTAYSVLEYLRQNSRIAYLLSVTGAVIGTMISFYLAKLLGSEAMHLFFGEEKVKEYQRRLNSGKGLLLAFLIYLIPGVPKDLVSYAAGISEMRFRPFLLAATVGRSPAMLGSLLVGHFFGKQNYMAMIIITAVIVLLLLLCFLKRKELIAFLDKIEMQDAASEEKFNG